MYGLISCPWGSSSALSQDQGLELLTSLSGTEGEIKPEMAKPLKLLSGSGPKFVASSSRWCSSDEQTAKPLALVARIDASGASVAESRGLYIISAGDFRLRHIRVYVAEAMKQMIRHVLMDGNYASTCSCSSTSIITILLTVCVITPGKSTPSSLLDNLTCRQIVRVSYELRQTNKSTLNYILYLISSCGLIIFYIVRSRLKSKLRYTLWSKQN